MYHNSGLIDEKKNKMLETYIVGKWVSVDDWLCLKNISVFYYTND